MITVGNLPDLLAALGFTKRGAAWRKSVEAAMLEVDFANRKIRYPEALTINNAATCNFAQDENFVVFDCAPDTKQILPLFLAQMMNSKTFQQEAVAQAIVVGDTARKQAIMQRYLRP